MISAGSLSRPAVGGPGPLRTEDWELVGCTHTIRRILGAAVLALGVAGIEGGGSGYPAGVGASGLDGAACLLAAADVLHALSEPRPHRPALDLRHASRLMAGLPLDRDAVRAVLDAAGAPQAALPPLPADLTERELEILRRLAVGRTKGEIAAELVISPSTVHTHTVHIYAKCEVSTRAALAMFAMRHGLAAATG